MAACRRFSHVAKINRIYLSNYQKFYSTNVDVRQDSLKTEDVVIPYRIHREPTDILKALASTISKDYTAPLYKYEDDPYFIPASNVSKRAFALSKESGRIAARYFLENHPEIFKCNTSVPHIKAFDPPVVYSEDNVSSCESLIECITNFDVNNAIIVYDILKKKDIPVNQAIKQDLLEILCFYNGSQPPDEDYYEERYFARMDGRMEKWNAKGMAEQLFEEMEKDHKSYSAMIAGAAKFQDSERALFLLGEMRSKDLAPSIEAYNSMIFTIPMSENLGESRWEYALNILGNMSKDGLKPDLFTMNACLELLAKSRGWRKFKSTALSFLAEMKRLNVEPSLGTYSIILNIFFSENSSDISVLYEILNQIEGKEFEVRHPLDVTFFVNAMDVCGKFAQDKELAYRINNLLELKRNCKLLGNAFSESRYFKNFLKILTEFEELDKLMEVYERYVPNIYTPEPAVVFSIVQKIHFTGHYKYLPKLCSDVLVFEQTERENILSLALEAAGIMKHEKQVQEELVNIVSKMVEKLNKRLQNNTRLQRYNFCWTGEMLGNVLKTFMNGEDFEKSCKIMEQCANEEQSIVGFPEKDTLLKFCELSLQNQAYDKVKVCIRYAVKGGYPDFGDDFKKLTDDMFEKQKIEPKDRNKVDDILSTMTVAGDSSDSSGSSDSSDSSSSDEEDEK